MNMDILQDLTHEVLKRQKTLAEIFRKNGDQSLFDYVQNWSVPETAVDPEVISIIQEMAGKLYGKDFAQGLAEQIALQPLVSTIDHHGIFGHPFFLNANLIFSLRQGLKYLPVFPTSGVSLNNSSWPGCITLTNINNNSQFRLSFFKDVHKTKTVYGTVQFLKEDVQKVIKRIKNLDFLEPKAKQKLEQIISETFLNKNVLLQKTFSAQASILSTALWTQYVPQAAKLAYLPLEDIISEILIRLVFNNSQHILNKLLFTKEGLNLVEKYFFGVRGGFGQGKGSFMFWGIDSEGRRSAFLREGVRVLSQNSGQQYELNSKSLTEGLSERKIYPTSLLCFLVTLYYGFNCIGGFNQTSWLTEIKTRFVLLLKELGEQKSALKVAGLITDNFAETALALYKVGDRLIKPSLMDLFLADYKYEQILEFSKKITLKQSLQSELPEIYKIVVPADQRHPELLGLSLPQIANLNGLTKILTLL